MRNFRKSDIWQEAIKLDMVIYSQIEQVPDSEKFGLKSQIPRGVISIPANIAEGCAKDSQNYFLRFLQISLGSAFELENHFIICSGLSHFKLDTGLLSDIHKL
jgi:four helix bundle protein